MEQDQRPTTLETLAKFRWPIIIGCILVYFLFFNKSDKSSNSETVTIETVYEPTQGVITTLEQVGEDEFKIKDEQIVDTKEESMVIVNYTDGEVDTFSMAQIQTQSTTEETSRYRYRPSYFSTFAMAGLLGYTFGSRPMSTPINRSAYTSSTAYNRSSTAGVRQMKSTARTNTVRRTSSGRSGYGSGRSTRSYGG